LETATKKLYEGMFLIDSALAASDWDGVLGFIGSILDKVNAELISIRKWNESRLAYEINHKPRGTYILAYFRLEGSQVSVLEREVQLSEKILRVLVLNAEHMTEEDLQKATPVEKDENKLAKAESKITAPADGPQVDDEPKELATPLEDKLDKVDETEELDEKEQ